jgi:hypothetical protein
MTSWTATHLWRQLTSSSSPERSSIEGLLQQWMPEIENVLNAGTSPLDFTLHDKDHSFRVAEWMARIVPEDVLPKLTAYEVALLLLSAYLHDIGMTPEQARVQRHWRHLVFGPLPEEEGRLSREEADEFQIWLDDERGGLVPPLAPDGRAGEHDLRLAAELITYYARYKHNDWSAEWIRRNAAGAFGSYEGWVEDLVRLCQSHHEDYASLVKEAFDPRPAGRHGEVVHLRYLACVLRVADILDVDPERTPPVLFRHRNIDPKSVIYWYKDHEFWVNPDGSTLVIHARPTAQWWRRRPATRPSGSGSSWRPAHGWAGRRRSPTAPSKLPGRCRTDGAFRSRSSSRSGLGTTATSISMVRSGRIRPSCWSCSRESSSTRGRVLLLLEHDGPPTVLCTARRF